MLIFTENETNETISFIFLLFTWSGFIWLANLQSGLTRLAVLNSDPFEKLFKKNYFLYHFDLFTKVKSSKSNLKVLNSSRLKYKSQRNRLSGIKVLRFKCANKAFEIESFKSLSERGLQPSRSINWSGNQSNSSHLVLNKVIRTYAW